MIRRWEDSDMEKALEIHAANGLDERCFPNLVVDGVSNPLFCTKEVYEVDGQIVMMGFLKLQSEGYLLIDHTCGTPELRWQWLQEGMEHLKKEAFRLGLEQISVWIPPEIEKSFSKRLLELGFIRSPFTCFTVNVE